MAKHTIASFVCQMPARVRSLGATTLALYASIALAGVVMVVFVVAVLTQPPLSPPVEDEEVVAPVIRHPLTGAVLVDPLPTLPRAFAVMVENAADAWPLAGLEDAFLVIEAPVEASIPRFVAFFSEEAETAKIGPVRSARPYYLDWADELDAVYAHVGGSPEALTLLAHLGTLDLNEFFQGEYFYRSSARYAPHNAYTTMDDLTSALDELAPVPADYGMWTFKDGTPSGEAVSVAIDWTAGTTYDVTWTYDAATNAYVRAQGGTAQFLEGAAVAVAENVVVMASDVVIVDATGRRHIRTVGGGEAMVLQDGSIIVGTWKKEERTSRLRFFDSAGAEVAMNAGVTWIEVVETLGQAEAQ